MTLPPALAHRLKPLLQALVFVALLATGTSALAEDVYREINLPRQALQTSLTAVGEAFGTTIVAPGDLVREKTAPAISGRFTPTQAVGKLLEGSGLKAQQGAGGAITVQVGETTSAAQPGDPGLRLEPVIVTGERTERSLYETASSASVVTGEEIDKTPAVK